MTETRWLMGSLERSSIHSFSPEFKHLQNQTERFSNCSVGKWPTQLISEGTRELSIQIPTFGQRRGQKTTWSEPQSRASSHSFVDACHGHTPEHHWRVSEYTGPPEPDSRQQVRLHGSPYRYKDGGHSYTGRQHLVVTHLLLLWLRVHHSTTVSPW